MLKFALIVFVALCLGIGSGIARNLWESSQFKEQFSVVRGAIGVDEMQPVESSETKKDAEGPKKSPEAKVLGSKIHNFGSLEKGEEGTHVFEIENTGTAPLTITLTSTSCKCTLSDLRGKKKTIEPGNVYPVELSFKSDNWSKQFRQSATIETNDPDQRSIKLYVEGVILQPIRPEPAELVFSNTTSSEETEAKLKLYGYKWDDVVIEKLEFTDEASSQFFETEVTPLSKEELKKEVNAICGYEIVVKTKKGLPLGPLRQKLNIVTNHETIDVAIKGRVTGEFIINVIGNDYNFEEDQNLLEIGRLTSGRDVSCELVLSTAGKNGKDISISIDESETFPSSKHIRVEVLKDKFRKIGRLYQFPVRVTIPDDCPNVAMLGPNTQDLGRFTIKTTHPIEKKIEVYVSFAKNR